LPGAAESAATRLLPSLAASLTSVLTPPAVPALIVAANL
jgi:hypothetical protein